jgi:tryptophan 2,3-dioxygenase
VFVNAGLYIFVHLARNTWIKIIVIVILASTKFLKKWSISESIMKRKMIERACNKYKKLIHKLKNPIGNHTPRNTN